ncbi:NAD-binding protein [Litorivicinus lipolyticus]|uniref:L-threonate dehydrogenase n=1 Tax=Litorivicinus lipolyticus TaxID=418701 RepID=A0A5Q2QCJ2_9GAMM|nr:L-threonate dehydrogenase [Litorivicinus lipolyticus]QGG79550.1 NAD-binding protein [Litorivicinus lipolyticus]
MKTLTIGLGSMGMGAALSCHRAGLTSVGFDLNADALNAFAADGGTPIDRLDNADSIDVALIFVVNAQQAESVIFDSPLLDKLSPGAVVMNCVTLAPSIAKDLAARVIERGFGYIDAPVSGGALKASEGRMSVMASATPASMQHAQPVLDAIAEHVFRLGDAAGEGSKMKTINQLLAGVHIAAAAEAMNLAAALDMDLHQVIDVISKCAGTSWMFENRAPHIADGDYRPLSSVDIFVKDLGIVQHEARAEAAVTPLTDTSLGLFADASQAGLGRLDDSAVAQLLARQSQQRLPGMDE